MTSLAWYRERSLIAAMNLQSAFEQAVDRVSKAPQRWPIYFSNFRKYTLRQFPLSLVYQEVSSDSVVVAVAHGRRRPGYWMDRV